MACVSAGSQHVQSSAASQEQGLVAETWPVAVHGFIPQVTLMQGEVLSIPPFWLTVLTNVDSGIAIDMQQPAAFQAAVDRLLHRTIPELPAAFTLDQTVAVGRHFLTTLLRSLRRKVPRLAQFVCVRL